MAAKRVWAFQYLRDISSKGEKAPWYVGWYDLDNRRHSESCGSGAAGRKAADRRIRQIQSELDTNTHNGERKRTWQQFADAYAERVLSGLAERSQQEAKGALACFARIVRPGPLERIKADSIDAFKAKRRQEAGRKPGSKVSPATINKDLRHIKAALRVAHEWGWLTKVPKIRMEKEPGKLARYVTTEHFAALYHRGCHKAALPKNPGERYTAAEWWQALICFAYMTGWRISEIMALRWEDIVDGAAITRAADNKGKRDDRVPLHPVVIEHLEKLRSFHPFVFRWHHNDRKLWTEFHRLQELAGIKLTCRENHEHNGLCHVYGFHDFRRAFATMNAEKLTGDALQTLMRHKSYATTQRYINLARQLNRAVDNLHVPEALAAAAG